LKHIESVFNGRLHPSATVASATLNADTRVLKSLIQVLGQIDDPGAVNLLGKLKNDPDTGIRMDVVKALSQHPLAAAKAAIYLLLKDHDPGVRKEVIEAAVTNPDSRAAAALINHFAEDRSDRRLVCSALAKIGGEKVVDFFVCILTGQSRTDFNLSGKVDEESRLFALNYLARHLNSDVLAQLQNYLEAQKKHLLSVFKRDPLEPSIVRLVQGSVSKSGLPIQR
jgi:HEAT repeat protein